MNEILTRLTIFKNTKMITEEDEKRLIECYNYLVANNCKDEEKLNGLLTHIVMMVVRTNKKEQLECLNQEVIDQIQNNQHYAAAMGLLEQLKQMFEISKNEEAYILLHLCNLLGE